MANFEEFHTRILKHQKELTRWHQSHREGLPIPAYSSIDIRDSGPKIASVDTNIFPAGFNNICETDQEAGPDLAKAYLETLYGPDKKKLLLVTEEHTKNAYYWQNVFSLKTMIETAGYELEIAFPREMDSIDLVTANGQQLVAHGSMGNDNGEVILSNGFKPEIILSNNDFSVPHSEWAETIASPINPPRELGWYQRKKSDHFNYYNSLAKEFSDILELPYSAFQIKSEVFSNFNVSDDDSKIKLAATVDRMIAELREEYSLNKIETEPSIFVKNNSGTYGLAVNRVTSGEDILKWNNRARTKMKAAKGGKQVEEVILQEGIPSRIKWEDSVAEPVIYLFGCQLLGGFLRTHKEKGESESLNSPGAVYKRLCMSDLLIHSEDSPLENVYGWIARISSLAVGKEIQSKKINFPTSQCV